jgi:hypothetical protein
MRNREETSMGAKTKGDQFRQSQSTQLPADQILGSLDARGETAQQNVSSYLGEF